MATTLVLPRVSAFKLRGLQPIFSADIDFSVRAGPSIVLGGNGLGKTTLVQAVVYGLTGGVGDTIESDRKLRWDHSYFRSRMRPAVAQASIEVSFRLQEEQITVRRGFSGAHPTAVRGTSLGRDWVEGDQVEDAFLRLIRRFGGYGAIADFAFVVNRLLYLPENRRLLAWDTDAQTRILMLINGDIAAEEEFRKRRAELKRIDSRKRHVHVQVGYAEKELTKLLEAAYVGEEEDEEGTEATAAVADALPELVESLQTASQKRLAAEDSLRQLGNVISDLSAEIERVEEQLEEAEAGIVWNLLDASERERNLAIHKLLENGICPCCGTVERSLQSTARQNQKDRRCYLCGSEQDQVASPQILGLRTTLAEKLSLLQSNEQVYIVLGERARIARDAELSIQSRVNEIRFSQPLIHVQNQDLTGEDRDSLLARKAELESEEARLAMQLRELQADLDRDYKTFLNSFHARLTTLRASYEEYATAFLGVNCSLAGVQDGDRLLGLTAFVPEFDGSPRTSPESCSEAQRFFLDIAFRMALIDMATSLSGFPATFICETPENALDVSYIDNVVGMFKRFSANRHALLFTANLQHKGIAQKMMADVAAGQRAGRVINLLDFGRLSGVQERALKTLRELARKVIQ
jgi:AAA domain